MLRALNHKSNLNKTNFHKRKYHAYLEKYEYFAERSRKISHSIACAFEYGEAFNESICNRLLESMSISVQSERIYNLLKKLDENQEILKSDYDNEMIEMIEVGKKDNMTTSEVYAKFDKFKQSIE